MRGTLLWLSLLILALSGCLAQANMVEPPLEATPIPEMAYDFTLETLSGEPITLSDLRGQWVLLNFWASWCKPCIEEMPYLQKLANESGLVVLGINFNESPEMAAQFVADHKLTFPILLHPDDITLLMYQVRGLPRTFVIAPDGTIALRVIGGVDPEELDAWLVERLPQSLTEEVSVTH